MSRLALVAVGFAAIIVAVCLAAGAFATAALGGNWLAYIAIALIVLVGSAVLVVVTAFGASDSGEDGVGPEIVITRPEGER